MTMNAPTARLKTKFKLARILPRVVMIDPPFGATIISQTEIAGRKLKPVTRHPLREAPDFPPRHAGPEYAELLGPCQAHFACWCPAFFSRKALPWFSFKAAGLVGYFVIP